MQHTYLQQNADNSLIGILVFYLTERLQRKRVGTLENVISDLKRFRDMDNKESVDTDAKATSNPMDADTATKEESSAV